MINDLYTNKWISLKEVVDKEKGISGYVFSHESRCQGTIVAILPFRKIKDTKDYEYLLKCEVTPCWNIDLPVRSSITGGCENNSHEEDVIRELLEETGYEIIHEDLISLGISYGTKSTDTRYVLYSCDLTDKEQGVAEGDGSRLESEAEAVWIKKEEIASIFDPQVSVMFVRLQDKILNKK